MPDTPSESPGKAAKGLAASIKKVPKPVLFGVLAVAVAIGLYLRHKHNQDAQNVDNQDATSSQDQTDPNATAGTYDPGLVYGNDGSGAGYYDPGMVGGGIGAPGVPSPTGAGGGTTVPADPGTPATVPSGTPGTDNTGGVGDTSGGAVGQGPSIDPSKVNDPGNMMVPPVDTTPPAVSTGGGAPQKPAASAHFAAQHGHSARFIAPGVYEGPKGSHVSFDPHAAGLKAVGHSQNYTGPGTYVKVGSTGQPTTVPHPAETMGPHTRANGGRPLPGHSIRY